MIINNLKSFMLDEAEEKIFDNMIDNEVSQMEEDKTILIIDRIMGEVLDFRLLEKLSVEQEALIREDLRKILDELL